MRQRDDHDKRKPGFCRLRRQTGLRFPVQKEPSKPTRSGLAGNIAAEALGNKIT
jgi:hypothetical protein